MMVLVLDLKISNLNSVLNVLDYLGIKHFVSNKAKDFAQSTHIILPGVGSFEAGMRAIEENNLLETLRFSALIEKKPILGICLGMQLLFDESEESPGVKGLSLIKGKVQRLNKSPEYPIPRIGWCESAFTNDFLGFKKLQESDFYYIHSYHAIPEDASIIAIQSGTVDKVTSGIQYQNIYGTQFHPEKSHKAGLRILEVFSK